MPALELLETEHIPHLKTNDVQFKCVLVPIDFSKQTERALTAAIQIAKSFGSTLFLVNAAVPGVYGTGVEPVPIEVFEANLQLARQRMSELADGNPSLAKIPHQQIVAYAMPLDLIQQVIAGKGIDLVIAGSHGASGVERFALGSVADTLLRTLVCPVLVIGPHDKPQDNLFSSILLASSLTPAGLRSARYASALAEHFHSKLSLLYVIEAKSPRCVQPELLQDHFIEELQELVPTDLPIHATATAEVEYGKPGDLIVSSALCRRSSLIVTGAREEKSFADRTPWSTLAQVIRRAPCPVLCVRGDVN